MAREQVDSPQARVFVALDIPDSIRAGIEEWGREALADPALRPVAAPSLHLTLCFLGNRRVGEISRLEEVLRGLAAPRPRVELDGPVARPTRGRARLYALEAVSPQTVAFEASLRGRLVEADLITPENRPFWPHLTVARVRSEGGRTKRPMRVPAPPGPLPKDLQQAFGGVRVTLYRSKLQPQGAQYIPLAQVELSEDGRQ